MSRARVDGTVLDRFEPVKEQLIGLSESEPEFGAHVAVMHRGELVVDIRIGDGVRSDALTPVFSATKGAAAMVIAVLVDGGDLDLGAPVSRYWPEFAAQGKADVRVDQLLSHQAGLISAPGLTAAEVLASVPAAERLAATRPWWRPGAAVGYHGLTIGVLMEELVRRVAGARLQDIYESVVRRPLDLEVYLGVPEELHGRHIKSRYPLNPPLPPLPPTADDLAAYAFLSTHRPFLLNEGDLDPFAPDVRASGFAGGGGAASASGLVRLYSAAMGQFGDPLFTDDTLARMTQLQVIGDDLVLGTRSAFGTVFARPHPGNPFGSYEAFGHDGAGGIVAFADPLYGLSFAFIPDPMVMTPESALALSNTARRCAVEAT